MVIPHDRREKRNQLRSRPRTARDPHIMSLNTAASLSRALGVSLDEFWQGLDQG